MNKTQLIEEMSAVADISKASATRALEGLVNSITDALQKGEQVVLAGFGTFYTRERAARVGRNPQTGEAIEIKAATMPGFKAGKALKEAINQGEVGAEED